jgi:hypothetical protein
LIREKDKPWFSNKIRKEIRIRDRLRKTILKSQNENKNYKVFHSNLYQLASD